MGVSKNIPANRRSMAGFAPVPLLAAGLAISLCEKSIGEGFSSASGVVTTPGSLSTAERKSKETRVEPVDLENITMIGQLTIEERASTAAFPNDRLDGREGGSYPSSTILRHRRLIGAGVYQGWHRRQVSSQIREARTDGGRNIRFRNIFRTSAMEEL